MANAASYLQAQRDERLAREIEQLFRAHYRGLCAHVRDFVYSIDAAEEIVQEVFLRVWDNCRLGRTELPTKAYLYAAARNHALSVLRHERVLHDHETRALLASDNNDTDPTVQDDIEVDELTTAARNVIARLPDKCRRVFTLSRERGLTYVEIAQVLGISVKTVELHMTRAFKALRAELRDL